MQTFIVRSTNRPGELANLTGALASKDVNILITALGVNGQGVASFICNDEGSAQTALQDAGFDVQTVPTVFVRLLDQPGQTFEVSRKLGDQGINIHSFFPVNVTDDTCVVAIGVDNIEAATKALGDQVVEYTYS
ncbi:MAG TPA: hypothetical protein VG602_06225 [Actinomycetota bacterium]|nr:hypothetical protein [Actinomycetota bacterium]